MIFPWQANQWQYLMSAYHEQRLAHALLFAGMKGIGKAQFVENFVRFLLCEHGEQYDACQGKKSCHACRLIEGRVHPNVLWIEPEKVGQAIKVDQIRTITDFINQSTFQANYKIAIINPAQEMNINAANALLKTLEEPTPYSIIILVSDQSKQLPTTILSRCQRLVFTIPEKQEALGWLRAQLKTEADKAESLLTLANGAPLTALQLVKENNLSIREIVFQSLITDANPLQAAEKLNAEDADSLCVLDFMLSWTMDLLNLKLTNDEALIINQDYLASLSSLTRIQVDKLIKFMQELQLLRKKIVSGLNLNKQLMIEAIFIDWHFSVIE